MQNAKTMESVQVLTPAHVLTATQENIARSLCACHHVLMELASVQINAGVTRDGLDLIAPLLSHPALQVRLVPKVQRSVMEPV